MTWAQSRHRLPVVLTAAEVSAVVGRASSREHQLRDARAVHDRDLAAGAGEVELPFALGRKYANAGREWPWQWVFPASRTYRDRETGAPSPSP